MAFSWAVLSVMVAVASAQIQGDGCKSPATITASSGTFFSPYYNQPAPNNVYPNNMKCKWTIVVPTGMNIRINFTNPMQLESCNYDWVAIFPGPRDAVTCSSKTGVLAGPICPAGGAPPPGPFVVQGNTIVVEFCTDSSQAYRGFELNFAATSDVPAPIPTVTASTSRPTTPTPGSEGCGGHITLNETSRVQHIQSPNYPGAYPNSIRCVWTINNTLGEAIKFDAETFNLEGSMPSCSYDWVDFIENSGSIAGKFCGTTAPMNVASEGGQVTVEFRTDSSGTGNGFRIRMSSYVPKCQPGEGRCPNTGDEEFCFNADQLCDGTAQCPNAADEYCPSGCGIPPNKPILSTKDGEKIVGGVEAKPHSWPWQILMTRANGAQLCGGSIIDHHWIVTAAHCCAAVSGTSPSRYKVRVGEHRQNTPGEPNAWTYELEKVIQYPLYSNSEQAYDICLLKTKMPIFFNDDVYPVCLASATDPPVGTDCFVTGWGSTSPARTDLAKEDLTEAEVTSRVSNELRQVDVKIADQEQCRAAYASMVDITDDMICGVNPGKDSCQGDSGGPYVCPSRWNPDSWELTGVVSFGLGCARPGYPGVYARTSYFLDWIAEHVMNS